MKLKQLLENTIKSKNKFYEIVNKKCSKFIKESRDIPLYRGLNSMIGSPERYFYKTIRKDRRFGTALFFFKNVNDNQIYFNYLNELMKKSGLKTHRGNSILATGNRMVGKFYGKLCRIYIEDGYNYLWSPKIDDYATILDEDTEIKELGEDKKYYEAIKLFWDRYGKTYQTNNLPQAIKSNNEILISGKGYYAIEVE